MTANERSEEVVRQFVQPWKGRVYFDRWSRELKNIIESHIVAAIEEEREACAKFLEQQANEMEKIKKTVSHATITWDEIESLKALAEGIRERESEKPDEL